MKKECEAFITNIDKTNNHLDCISIYKDGETNYQGLTITFLEKRNIEVKIGNIFKLEIDQKEMKGEVFPLEKSIVEIDKSFFYCGNKLSENEINDLLSFQKEFNKKAENMSDPRELLDMSDMNAAQDAQIILELRKENKKLKADLHDFVTRTDDHMEELNKLTTRLFKENEKMKSSQRNKK